MLLKLQQAGKPVLRKVARTVTRQELATKYVQDIIDCMIATLRDAPGVGLAAPQIGESLQICIIEDKAKYHKNLSEELLKAQDRKSIPLMVLVNPKLEILDEETELFFEGCLSIDDYAGAVPRARKVAITGWDREGKEVSFTATNYHARILQHEIDHLDGHLYVDRMKPKSFMTHKNFVLLWKNALPEKINKSFK